MMYTIHIPCVKFQSPASVANHMSFSPMIAWADDGSPAAAGTWVYPSKSCEPARCCTCFFVCTSWHRSLFRAMEPLINLRRSPGPRSVTLSPPELYQMFDPVEEEPLDDTTAHSFEESFDAQRSCQWFDLSCWRKERSLDGTETYWKRTIYITQFSLAILPVLNYWDWVAAWFEHRSAWWRLLPTWQTRWRSWPCMVSAHSAPLWQRWASWWWWTTWRSFSRPRMW